jgi:hypothetical protein
MQAEFHALILPVQFVFAPVFRYGIYNALAKRQRQLVKTSHGSRIFPSHPNQRNIPRGLPTIPAEMKVRRCALGINLKNTRLKIKKPMIPVT